jgi:hypothetical protein
MNICLIGCLRHPDKWQFVCRVADLPFSMGVSGMMVVVYLRIIFFYNQDGSGEQDIPNVIEIFKTRYDSLEPNTKLVKDSEIID